MLKRNEPLTYEQLSQMFNCPVNEINSSICESYNKMVDSLVYKYNFDIWDVVFELRRFFGMTEQESVEKLNKKNKEMLIESARLKFNKN